MLLLGRNGGGYTYGGVTTSSDLVIANPGAEAGNTSGWSIVGNFTTRASSVGPPSHSGAYYFYGGYGASSSAFQNIPIAANSLPHVDGGGAHLDFSWYQRSWNNADRGDIEIEFLDSSSASLGAAVGLGMVASSSGSWDLRTHIALVVPAGARFVKITMKTQRYSGSNSDAYFDDLAGNIY